MGNRFVKIVWTRAKGDFEGKTKTWGFILKIIKRS